MERGQSRGRNSTDQGTKELKVAQSPGGHMGGVGVGVEKREVSRAGCALILRHREAMKYLGRGVMRSDFC